MANKAIKRPYTQIPTMEDIVHKFQSAERFTKLDIKESYHQFVLIYQGILPPSMVQMDFTVTNVSTMEQNLHKTSCR